MRLYILSLVLAATSALAQSPQAWHAAVSATAVPASAPSSAQVTCSYATGSQIVYNNGGSFNITLASNAVDGLVVFSGVEGANAYIAAATFDGSSMSYVYDIGQPNPMEVYALPIGNKSAGTYTIAWTGVNTVVYAVQAVVFEHCQQFSPTNSVGGSVSSSATLTLPSITSQSGSAVVVTGGSSDSSLFLSSSPSCATALNVNGSGAQCWLGFSTATGANAFALTYGGSMSRINAVAFELMAK